MKEINDRIRNTCPRPLRTFFASEAISWRVLTGFCAMTSHAVKTVVLTRITSQHLQVHQHL